jgi:hypothetical protein
MSASNISFGNFSIDGNSVSNNSGVAGFGLKKNFTLFFKENYSLFILVLIALSFNVKIYL